MKFTDENPKLTRWSLADWACYLFALTGIATCLIALALALLSNTAEAGIFSPPQFIPNLHADGTRTWQVAIDVSDLKYAKPRTDSELVGVWIGSNHFCANGWVIDAIYVKNKTKYIDGHCTE